MLSVLVSVHKTGQWLSEALDSIAASGLEIEILVAANGSGDRKAVQAVQDTGDYHPLAQFFYRRKTLSLSDSLNDLLARATGNMVCRLDPDDRFKPLGLVMMVFSAESTTPSVAYGHYQDFGDPRTEGSDGLILCKEATPHALARHSVGPYCFVTQMETMRAAGGWREVGYEDWDLLVRLVALGAEPIPLDVTVLEHRVRRDGRLAVFKREHAGRVAEIYRANRTFFQQHGVKP